MTEKDDLVKCVKDDRRVDEAVAIKLSQETHICDATLLHAILIQL